MKKLFLTAAVLLMTLVAQAQTKFTPKLENGFKAVYIEEATIDAAGTTIKGTSESEYVVSNVTDKGAVITVTEISTTTDADQSNPMASLLAASTSLLKGISVKYNVDAEGKILGVANIDEVKEKASKASKALIDKIFKENPSLGDMVPREGLDAQFAQVVGEKALITGVTHNGVLGLSGKTIANGATESGEVEGMKTKVMYFVTGNKVIANASLDMTKDELKAFIVKKVEEEAPDQAEMIKQSIDMVMDQLKPDVKLKNTYTMQDNGWPQSIQSEMTQTMMGQTQKQTTTIKLKQ